MAFPVALAGVGGMLGAIVGTKAGQMALTITFLVGLVAALRGILGGILNELSHALPPEWALGIGLIPANFPTCASVLLVATSARWVYDTHFRVGVQLKLL